MRAEVWEWGAQERKWWGGGGGGGRGRPTRLCFLAPHSSAMRTSTSPDKSSRADQSRTETTGDEASSHTGSYPFIERRGKFISSAITSESVD